MQTKVSPRGRVALPAFLCHCLGIRAGDPLEATIEGGRIVLTPSKGIVRQPKHEHAGKFACAEAAARFTVVAPVVTRKEVEAILAYIPSSSGPALSRM
jgi:AbrB family looped-hinge helix DNA binding protein